MRGQTVRGCGADASSTVVSGAAVSCPCADLREHEDLELLETGLRWSCVCAAWLCVPDEVPRRLAPDVVAVAAGALAVSLRRGVEVQYPDPVGVARSREFEREARSLAMLAVAYRREGNEAGVEAARASYRALRESVRVCGEQAVVGWADRVSIAAQLRWRVPVQAACCRDVVPVPVSVQGPIRMVAVSDGVAAGLVVWLVVGSPVGAVRVGPVLVPADAGLVAGVRRRRTVASMDDVVDEVVAGDELVGESRLFRSPELADLLEAEIASARMAASVEQSVDDEDALLGGLLDGVVGHRGPAVTVRFLPVL